MFTVAVVEQPEGPVTVTVYVPDEFTAALLITGSSVPEVNPAGPVQEKLLPLVVRLRLMLPFSQTGELEVTPAEGTGLMETATVPVLVHPVTPSEAVTVYDALAVGVTVGFCKAEVKPTGDETQE